MKRYKVIQKTGTGGHKIYIYKETWYSKLFPHKKEKIEEKEKARRYMKSEWIKSSPFYIKYFDQWWEGITEHQLSCIFVWMSNKLGPMP